MDSKVKPFFSIAIPTWEINGKGAEYLEHSFNIIAQQTWLRTIDHPASKFLVKFLDDVQDLILDTDEVIEYKIANEGRPVKQARPSNLKLVVSNYFTPRERLDRPFPPAPELTMLK